MKIKLKEAIAFCMTANHYLRTTEGETKLKYALRKVVKSLEPEMTKFDSDKEDIAVDHAFTDKQRLLVMDYNPVTGQPSGYKFTPEAKKKVKAATLCLMEAEVIVTPHVITEVPELPEDLIEIFNGFVLNAKVA